ncbi:hypothetical protein [Streptomyces sp. NPDC059168]|uniref:hypothetical protein n=1 Tax=Streptomyces sp. NPDC059168 TaxID=3346753 RepID=UPI0036B4605F
MNRLRVTAGPVLALTAVWLVTRAPMSWPLTHDGSPLPGGGAVPREVWCPHFHWYGVLSHGAFPLAASALSSPAHPVLCREVVGGTRTGCPPRPARNALLAAAAVPPFARLSRSARPPASEPAPPGTAPPGPRPPSGPGTERSAMGQYRLIRTPGPWTP